MRTSLIALAAICCLAQFAVTFAAESKVSAAASADNEQYFVLIDAGSTGSRAHVHKYFLDGSRPLPIVEESDNRKIKPGLSSYAKDPAAASRSIQDLLEFIRSKVPEDRWPSTPIHLQATAGLRSVTTLEANAILEVVRDDLVASGFKFQRSWAKIIPGEQEGINGWMAVNYLLGVFDLPTEEGGAAPTSTGVVEMGGSSMQITFAPSSPGPEDKKQLTEIKVAGHSYWLYTHSFLQYGLQAAEKLYQRLAITDIEEKGNPCYPRSLRHSAIGDFEHCTSLLQVVVDKTVKCATHSCSFNGVYQPKIADEQFLAIENFYYTAKFFGTHEQQEQQDGATGSNSVKATPTGNQLITGLRAKGKEFCNKDWSILAKEYAQTPREELQTFCFSAAYQSVVLDSGLGFHPGANLKVAKTIGGKGIDWEMGATILELLKEQDEQKNAKMLSKDGKKTNLDMVDPGLPLPPVSMRSKSKKANAAASGSHWCSNCIMYTILFAVVLVAAYFTYVKLQKSRSTPSSFAQSAFNRV